MKKQKQRNACAIKTSIGGQALMEGIMMRGPKQSYMAVRNPKGEIVIEEIPPKTVKFPKLRKIPLVRGIFGFIDSMSLGYKALMRSAEISGLEDMIEENPKKKKKEVKSEILPASEEAKASLGMNTDEKASEEPVKEEEKLPSWAMNVMMTVAMVLAVVLALGLFFYAPSKIYSLLSEHLGLMTSEDPVLNSLWKSVFEGVFKIVLLVGYMLLISLMKDIRRTFMYHGAEHKTIFCYEAGLPLTVENVRLQKRFHPRCGTSFLILMLLVSIFVSFFIDPVTVAISGDVLPPLLRTVLRLALFPLVMGIGYELIRLAGRHDNVLTRIISFPGVLLQHVTVLEPTDDMIECAIESVKRVIPEDGSDRI